jgi:hypothetical protein
MLMGAEPMAGRVPSVGSHFRSIIIALPYLGQYLEKLLVIPFAYGAVRFLVMVLRKSLHSASITMLLGYCCQI